jgi:hypothetical protein
MSRRWPALVVVASLLAAVGPARADGTAAASETARALFNEGLALRGRGDLEGAIAKLRAAHALRATPVTALELARAYVEHRDLVEARDLLLSVKRLPVVPPESRDSHEARRDAAKMADELKPRIPTLTIAISGAGAGAAARPIVLIDDVEIPPEAVLEPQHVNPKRHHVIARATRDPKAPEASTDIELHEAESARVVLELPAIPSRSPAPAPAPAPPSEPASRSSGDATMPRLMTYGGFGLAFVGVVVGTYAGLRAIDQVSQLKSACNADRICTPSEANAIASAKTSGNVATAAFVLAGVGALVGLTGLWLWRRADSSGTARLAIVGGPGAIGVRGVFR